MDTASSKPALGAEQADFIQGHVTMVVASRDVARRPVLVRALGCAVSVDRRELRLFMSQRQSGDLQACLRQTQAVAAVFTRPSTHRSLQVKGCDARVQAPTAADREALQRYRRLCAEELGSLGYTEAFTHALLATGLDDALVVSFTPHTVFEQTPGPAAGERIAGAA